MEIIQFLVVCILTISQYKYSLQGRVEKDIKIYPSCQDMQVGIQVYHRHKICKILSGNLFKLPSDLSIYKSRLKNSDGSRRVIGGPHEVFTRMKSTYQAQMTTFLSNQYHIFKTGLHINPHIPLLLTKVEKGYMHDLMIESKEKGKCNDEKRDEFKQN